MQVHLTDIEFASGLGKFCLHVPELAVESGSTVAVVGPSGSGNSTEAAVQRREILLQIVAGADRGATTTDPATSRPAGVVAREGLAAYLRD